MKFNYILIALAMLAALSMVSCKSNKKTQEPALEEIQAQKQALADSVLAEIDELAAKVFDAQSKAFTLGSLELTDAEKMVKPDYLLDPSVAATLVTKSQKVNAIAIYGIELGIRKIYDMPYDDVQEVISKLVAEVNHPIDVDYMLSDKPMSDKIKNRYEICKERGDLAYFWQFEEAGITEINYIVAQNPELFFNKIPNEQWVEYYNRRVAEIKALDELAKYDDEVAMIRDFRVKYSFDLSQEELDKLNQSKELRIQFRIDNKDQYVAKRNALLQ